MTQRYGYERENSMKDDHLKYSILIASKCTADSDRAGKYSSNNSLLRYVTCVVFLNLNNFTENSYLMSSKA